MNEAVVQAFLTLFADLSREREWAGGPGDVGTELGVGGWVRRIAPEPVVPGDEGEVIYARMWGETLIEARSELGFAMESAGVPHLLYKGGALLGREFAVGDISPSDLDILVPLESRSAAVQVFERLGWRRKPPVGGPPMPGGPGAVFERPFAGAAVSALDVDVHWRVDPVDRLFPWRGRSLLQSVFDEREGEGPCPRPRPGHHAALLVHHFVRHDLLHFRSLFDLAVIWPDLLAPPECQAFYDLSRWLGVQRMAEWLAAGLNVEIGLPTLGPPWAGGSTMDARRPSIRALTALALDADEREFEAMTVARGLRRLRTIDAPLTAAPKLIRDALFPPDEYLAWRWPGVSRSVRWRRHLSRVVGRVTDG